MACNPLGTQTSGEHEGHWPTIDTDWDKAVATLFMQEDRPRWALLLAGSRVYLFDAHTYAQGRYLYVNLDDAFARKQAKTFESIAALLSCDTLAPGGESDGIRSVTICSNGSATP